MKLTINGSAIEIDARFNDWTLLKFLREELKLTGTKQGCDHEGTCGLCRVIIDGKVRNACKTILSSLDDGSVIETVESLSFDPQKENPHPLIQTVIEDGIFQCGYCAPGALMSAKSIIDQQLNPQQKDISRMLSGVLCRCAGLNRMDQSVMRAAAILRGDVESTWSKEKSEDESFTIDKLTGQLKYTDDITFPGMLCASALRANVPHAKVLKIDVEKAERIPGIVCVLTSKDVPGQNRFGVIQPDQPIFCDEENDILFVGDTLALVVGEDQESVEAALTEIEVHLEPLPVVSSIDDALKDGATVLHKRLSKKYPDMPNVLVKYHTSKGDIDAGFAEADVIMEDDYFVPFIEHAYMEPETGIAVPENGGVVIYAGSQGPGDDRRQIAAALDLAQEKVHIAHVFMGGGFGGKEDISTQIHAALAAVKTGRPVKVKWSRKESLLVSYKRHAVKMHYKMGVKNDGRIVAADISIYGDTGAYASSGEAVLFRTSAFACGPYEIPHVSVHAYAVHTNNPPCGAFRGYGSPQVAFACEIHLQKIIEHLKLDPFDVRLQNGLDIGKATITGDVITEEVGVGLIPCLRAVQKELEDKKGLYEVMPGEKLGFGIAAAYKNVGLGSNIPDSAGADISLEEDGCFLVRHGATDMGQGSTQLVAAIAARIFGIPMRMVRVHTADTRVDPDGGMTTASRATFLSGNATLKAAEGLKTLLWEEVASEFTVPVDEIDLHDYVFINRQTGKELISLKELASCGHKFSYKYLYNAPKTQPPLTHSASNPAVPEAPLHFAYDFGVQAAVVAVNIDSGKVRVLEIIAAHDVGIPIIERNVIGQIEGAVVQGLGYALSEEYVVHEGIPQTTHLKDLGLLRLRDIPPIKPIIIEDFHLKGPFGAKGMGELALSPTAPAIANAIHHAVGIWVNTLPITGEKIISGMKVVSQ